MRQLAALALGKIILKITRFLNIGGGSAAPGLWALKIDPGLIRNLTSTIPQTVIITGTNGKTTTARLLAHFAEAQGLKVIRNATGSNLERGVASSLISCSHLSSGKLKKTDLAIWELDEAAFNDLAPKLHPQAIVFLNAFRDQLDRYGEVDTIIKRWSQTLTKLSPKTEIFLNADDRNLSRLKSHFQRKVQTFAVKDRAIRGEKTLGPEESIQPDFEVKNIQPRGLDKTEFEVDFQGKTFHFSLPLPGIYNTYNFLAAFTLASTLKIEPSLMQNSLGTFSSAFGRGEAFGEEKRGYIMLIKNPVGATQVFQTLQGVIQKNDRLLLALNDKLADGTDVSWIWDANFELLRTTLRLVRLHSPQVRSGQANHEPRTFCSGTRAYDLALRLKYAGFDPRSIEIETDLGKAFRSLQRGSEGRLFILPTYTAMLELQKILTRSGLKKHYWREEEI